MVSILIVQLSSYKKKLSPFSVGNHNEILQKVACIGSDILDHQYLPNVVVGYTITITTYKVIILWIIAKQLEPYALAYRSRSPVSERRPITPYNRSHSIISYRCKDEVYYTNKWVPPNKVLVGTHCISRTTIIEVDFKHCDDNRVEKASILSNENNPEHASLKYLNLVK